MKNIRHKLLNQEDAYFLYALSLIKENNLRGDPEKSNEYAEQLFQSRDTEMAWIEILKVYSNDQNDGILENKIPFVIYNNSVKSLRDFIKNNQEFKVNSAEYNFDNNLQSIINEIQQAELWLALEGSKISRIMMPISKAIQLQTNLEIPIIISTMAYQAEIDQILDGYSNCFQGAPKHISNATQDDEICVYIGQSWRLASLCAVLDQKDLAGTLLGIPSCCIEYYKKNWGEAALNFSGDLAFNIYKEHFSRLPEESEIEIPWELNSHAMYMGGGLLWHFPCSLKCKSSVNLVQERVRILSLKHYQLMQKLVDIQQSDFYLAEDRSIKHEKSAAIKQLHIFPKVGC